MPFVFHLSHEGSAHSSILQRAALFLDAYCYGPVLKILLDHELRGRGMRSKVRKDKTVGRDQSGGNSVTQTRKFPGSLGVGICSG